MFVICTPQGIDHDCVEHAGDLAGGQHIPTSPQMLTHNQSGNGPTHLHVSRVRGQHQEVKEKGHGKVSPLRWQGIIQ